MGGGSKDERDGTDRAPTRCGAAVPNGRRRLRARCAARDLGLMRSTTSKTRIPTSAAARAGRMRY